MRGRIARQWQYAAALIGTTAFLAGAGTAPQIITCPPGINLIETVDHTLPPDLIPYTDPSPSPPIGMALFAGNPGLGNPIAPTKSSHPFFNNDGTDTWIFAKARADLWFACLYGQNPVMVARPIKQAVKTCVAQAEDGNVSYIKCD